MLLLHGPNLNLLGTRQTEVYGRTSLAEIDQEMGILAGERGLELECLQSNHEGVLIDAIHQARDRFDYIIINPGAFTHYSYAIRDALASVAIPFIEVHLTNIYAREEFRQKSVIAPIARGQIAGLGTDSYFLALEAVSRWTRRVEVGEID